MARETQTTNRLYMTGRYFKSVYLLDLLGTRLQVVLKSECIMGLEFHSLSVMMVIDS